MGNKKKIDRRKIIEQEKTDQELTKKVIEMIDSLEGFNIAEKLKIINNLHYSLEDVIRKEGYVIFKVISLEDKED